jgi:hypothetical protein
MERMWKITVVAYSQYYLRNFAGENKEKSYETSQQPVFQPGFEPNTSEKRNRYAIQLSAS